VVLICDDHASIAKWLQTSKPRFARVVKPAPEEDITARLTEWINHPYHLILS